jgi:hypothetical protein
VNALHKNSFHGTSRISIDVNNKTGRWWPSVDLSALLVPATADLIYLVHRVSVSLCIINKHVHKLQSMNEKLLIFILILLIRKLQLNPHILEEWWQTAQQRLW